MEVWLIMLIIAAVLVIVEIAFQMVWSLCLAVGFVVAAVMNLSGVGAVWCLTAAAATSIVFYLLMIPVFERWQERARKRMGKEERTGMDALLGRTAIVIDPIYPGRLGRARIDGDYWQVRIPGGKETMERGSEVVVTAYDSIILDVVPKH